MASLVEAWKAATAPRGCHVGMPCDHARVEGVTLPRHLSSILAIVGAGTGPFWEPSAALYSHFASAIDAMRCVVPVGEGVVLFCQVSLELICKSSFAIKLPQLSGTHSKSVFYGSAHK